MAELIGRDFAPPDLRGKVTGAAKYSEDFRRDGMLFCRLLASPMPHARVLSVDATEALSMPGVVDILLPDDVPEQPGASTNILTYEPHFVGEPILAIAAVDETTAQNAIEAIKLELEPLEFCTDPLESLRAGGPNARTDGNTVVPQEGLQEVKWTEADFAAAGEGQLPMGQPGGEWSYGDLEAGFREASIILDESFVTAGTAHHCMEPRTAMAYWENGKCFLHGSCQSQSIAIPGIADLIGIEPEDLVFIAEYCGGGFGSKGRGVSGHGDSGLHVQEGRAARPHADQPSGGILRRLGTARLPGPHQDGIPRGRQADSGRPLHRSGERPERGRWRLAECGQRRLPRLYASRHAVSRDLGAYKHPSARCPAWSRTKPDRERGGAADR